MSLKHLTLALAVSGFGVLAGCSSPSVVQKSDGSQVVTPDEPEYDKKSGMYQYEQDGRKVQINKDDVKSIEEIK
ncbi:YgdI/YgdR family lipoprotein [Bordetella avium]|uniref:Lipoprotein n=1 Tax=Bordetella avium (strain 197N) TaxID=360910 RepID=Q2KZ43_BORA1|nr:YgdI/YgdR family lipoprotein [Bordetella avium]AZY49471.1 YgdI/YgdR family lipoprotein [Bordetella avium]AZY52868.1 YgdI/YgdR family lipoprotein [Bordetella avium]RIQ11752.1 YgdI/YgdR family lipoprotein [Bordetella avium]RIQ16175.1 YgdI/YgdR family lipoprotein [Bordetella avium]RIQ30328.1 YgdI/YgdR family lipoprotein [Bordetella avium]